MVVMRNVIRVLSAIGLEWLDGVPQFVSECVAERRPSYWVI